MFLSKLAKLASGFTKHAASRTPNFNAIESRDEAAELVPGLAHMTDDALGKSFPDERQDAQDDAPSAGLRAAPLASR